MCSCTKFYPHPFQSCPSLTVHVLILTMTAIAKLQTSTIVVFQTHCERWFKLDIDSRINIIVWIWKILMLYGRVGHIKKSCNFLKSAYYFPGICHKTMRKWFCYVYVQLLSQTFLFGTYEQTQKHFPFSNFEFEDSKLP